MESSVVFGSNDWVERLCDEINRSESYQRAARSWEGDFCFIVEPDGHAVEPICMYMDLYHGQCRQAFIVDDVNAPEPEFKVSGSMHVWQAVVQKKLDPIKALLTRKLKLTGNMGKIMRNVKAANELVNCTTKFDTEFPAG